MLSNSVKIQWMDDNCFASKLAKAISDAGLNPRKVSVATGVDYPYLTKLINYPEKYQASMEILNKLSALDFLKEVVEEEKEIRLLRDYDIDLVATTMIKMLNRDTPKIRIIKQKMKALLDGQ